MSSVLFLPMTIYGWAEKEGKSGDCVLPFELVPIISSARRAFLNTREDLRRVGKRLEGVWH